MNQVSLIVQNYIQYINKVISNHKLSHSYLIEINNYDEDLSLVYSFIKMIFNDCTYEDLNNIHSSINDLIDSGSCPDLFVVEPDGNNIKKGQLLDLQKEFSNKSLSNTKRVYLIKNAEKLNPASANTILKFLEEPEDNIIAILLTDSRYHVLETILSRCQVLSLKSDTFNIELTDNFMELLKCFVTPKDLFIKYNYLFENILIDKNSAIDIFRLIENVFIKYLDCYYLKKQSIPDEILAVLNKIDINKTISYLSIFEEELPKLDYNVNYKLWLDSLFSRLIMGG